RRRHTRFSRDWSSDVCSSDLSRRGTPLQTTQPAAPTVHCVPLGLLGKKPRPLPEHCSTVATVSTPMDLSSASVRLRGFFTPSIRSEERRVGEGGRPRWSPHT